jgi:sterol desaturase/sphingolipid hydroxylase (fatty acid hydroxylase superfamily)
MHAQYYIFAWYAFVAVIFALAESKWPAGSPSPFTHRVHNFSLAVVVALIMSAFAGALNYLPERMFGLGLTGLVFGRWKPSNGVAALICSTLIFAFVWDFFQYWAHRLQHTLDVLWETHALHHTDEHLNATSSLRNPVLANVVTYFLVTLPTIAICGGELLSIYGSIFLFATWGFFNHANIRLSLGPLTPVISGPQWHRLHHGLDPRYHDKNFAAFFPVLDLTFGTYLAPKPHEFPATGVNGRITFPSSFLEFFRSVISLKPSQ